MNDWRLQGQETYLIGAIMTFIHYRPYRAGWDHDHCEFCGTKFSLANEDLHEGYATENHYHWTCKPCFDDFVDMFQWKVVPPK